MLVTLSGMLTPVRELQKKKARTNMLVTQFGIRSKYREVQS